MPARGARGARAGVRGVRELRGWCICELLCNTGKLLCNIDKLVSVGFRGVVESSMKSSGETSLLHGISTWSTPHRYNN